MSWLSSCAQNSSLVFSSAGASSSASSDAANAEAFDADGFFHTGDAGYMKDGELFLQERIKDLFKTSNGKYVAPQMVEGLLLVDKFVDQVVVIADQRKFVSALIVPEFGTLEDWANKNGVVYSSREELCENMMQLYIYAI